MNKQTVRPHSPAPSLETSRQLLDSTSPIPGGSGRAGASAWQVDVHFLLAGRRACPTNTAHFGAPQAGSAVRMLSVFSAFPPRYPRLCGECALLALLLLTTACHKKADEAETEAPAPVQVAAVTEDTIHRTVIADGALYPYDQWNVMPKVTAPVARFLVNRGDAVKKDQLLAV